MCNSGKVCDVIIALIAADHAEFAIIYLRLWDLDRFGTSTRNGSSQKTVQRRRVNHLSRLHVIFKQFPTAAKVAARWRLDWWWCIWLFCASSLCRKTKHSWTKQAFHQTLETRPLEVSESASSPWWDGFECFDSCFCPSALGRLLLSSEIDETAFCSILLQSWCSDDCTDAAPTLLESGNCILPRLQMWYKKCPHNCPKQRPVYRSTWKCRITWI